MMLPSLYLSYDNYAMTRESIIEDMNQALAKTILKETSEQVTADTLKVFRENLKISRLKETSYIALCTAEPSKTAFCSDTMSYKAGSERLHIRAYPNCSKAAIFEMSEQEIPFALFVLSLAWGIFSWMYLHKKGKAVIEMYPENQLVTIGTLCFSKSSDVFLDAEKQEIYFTPMQFQLMKMFFENENHRLSVEEICRSLWPGKEDARDTLYTLVRRLKPVVEKASNVRIMSEKGHYYVLRIENG